MIQDWGVRGETLRDTPGRPQPRLLFLELQRNPRLYTHLTRPLELPPLFSKGSIASKLNSGINLLLISLFSFINITWQKKKRHVRPVKWGPRGNKFISLKVFKDNCLFHLFIYLFANTCLFSTKQLQDKRWISHIAINIIQDIIAINIIQDIFSVNSWAW